MMAQVDMLVNFLHRLIAMNLRDNELEPSASQFLRIQRDLPLLDLLTIHATIWPDWSIGTVVEKSNQTMFFLDGQLCRSPPLHHDDHHQFQKRHDRDPKSHLRAFGPVRSKQNGNKSAHRLPLNRQRQWKRSLPPKKWQMF